MTARALDLDHLITGLMSLTAKPGMGLATPSRARVLHLDNGWTFAIRHAIGLPPLNEIERSASMSETPPHLL